VQDGVELGLGHRDGVGVRDPRAVEAVMCLEALVGPDAGEGATERSPRPRAKKA